VCGREGVGAIVLRVLVIRFKIETRIKLLYKARIVTLRGTINIFTYLLNEY